MTTRLKSLKKGLLSNQIQDELVKTLFVDRLKPGDKLPSERELAEQFQVSRATVREALNQLRRAGLTETRRGLYAGSYVAEPCAGLITENFQSLVSFGLVNFAHIIEARLHFEPEIARTAALCASPDDIRGLVELLEKAESLCESSCKEARLVNVRFHNEVARISKNQILVFITDAITQVYSDLIIELTGESLQEEDVLYLIRGHRQILDRIIAKDGDGAAAMARQHLIGIFSVYSKVIPDNAQELMTE